jgi:hypothetical protein
MLADDLRSIVHNIIPAPVLNSQTSHIVQEVFHSAIMSSKQTTTSSLSDNTKEHAQVEKPELGAPRQNSEDYFQATDEYDDYDDFEIGTGGGGGGSKSSKRENNRGHSGSQGPYSAKHNRLRAERPKSNTAPK